MGQRREPKTSSFPSRSADLYAGAFDWADRSAIEGAFSVSAAFHAQANAITRLASALGANRTVGRHAVLRWLYFAEGHRLTQFELAAEMRVTSSNVTFLVDGLEREGLVQRVPHPTDRRTVYVQLTADGEALAARIVPSMARLMAAMFTGFDDREKQSLVELLERFRINAEAFDAASID